MDIRIRAIRPDDINRACELIQQLTGQEIRVEEMNNRLQLVQDSAVDELYVCEVNGSVEGLLGFRVRENLEQVSRYGEISLLVTDSQLQRKGIGRTMMNYAEQLAKEKGCLGTWLVSGLGRQEAHEFYKDLDYRITGYRFVKYF